MRKIGFIILFVFLFFLAEFFIFNMLGRNFMPNLLLVLIVFLNISFGIRYSLLSAVMAGLLRDSFSIGTFGIYIFSFVICAYFTTILGKHIYQKGSLFSWLLLVFIMTVSYVLIQYILRSMFGSISIFQTIQSILFPQVLMTLVAAGITFKYLKSCVLKLSV